MLHVLDVAQARMADWIAQRRLPAYRSAQVRRWLLTDRAESFDEMTDLPHALREELAAEFQIWTTRIARHSTSDDGTEKLLLALADEQVIECVLLRDGERRTICISSQVGCAMGCVFCASGLDGVARNLTSGEIVEQMLRLARLLPKDERLSHIVVMGMGEPLANLDSVLTALQDATSDDGLGIGARRITISTVGLPTGIDKLIEAGCRFNLAVSLHAADDELRSRLVKVSKNIGLAAILAAADRYFDASGRRLTFEYVLLAGVNDSTGHAQALAKLLDARSALVNLIPYNRVAGLSYETPAPAAVSRFLQVLRASGLNAQVRERKGNKIDAACGQLRRMAVGS